jgi:hypothetical protein
LSALSAITHPVALGAGGQCFMEVTMDMQSCAQAPPGVSAVERDSHDIVTRILKLRWMGMEVEAKQLEFTLRKLEPRETVLAGPSETD